MKKVIWALVMDTPDEPAGVTMFATYAAANEAAREFYMDTWDSAAEADDEPRTEPPADWDDMRMELQDRGYFDRYCDITHHTIETDELETA